MSLMLHRLIKTLTQKKKMRNKKFISVLTFLASSAANNADERMFVDNSIEPETCICVMG